MKKIKLLANGDEWSGKVKNGYPVGKGIYYYHRKDFVIKEGSFKKGKFTNCGD